MHTLKKINFWILKNQTITLEMSRIDLAESIIKEEIAYLPKMKNLLSQYRYICS